MSKLSKRLMNATGKEMSDDDYSAGAKVVLEEILDDMPECDDPLKQAILVPTGFHKGTLAVNPADDPYFDEMRALVRRLKRASRSMTLEDKIYAKAIASGIPVHELEKQYGVEIDIDAMKMKKSVKTVINVMTSIYLLRHGVSKEQRAHMLWRIAVANEERRPDLSIAAVNSLNKMDPALNQGEDRSNNLTVIVQAPALANSPLDAEGVSS